MRVSHYQTSRTDVELKQPINIALTDAPEPHELAEDDELSVAVLIGISQDDEEGEMLELHGTAAAFVQFGTALMEVLCHALGTDEPLRNSQPQQITVQRFDTGDE